MKKIKVSFLAVAAILLGICGSAFTGAPASAKSSTVDGWFIYDGSGPLDDPSNYAYTTDLSPCNAHVKFCAFKGTQQTGAPSRPTEASLDEAMDESNQFTIEVADLVVFKP